MFYKYNYLFQTSNYLSNEELLNLINGDYQIIHNNNIRIANEYLNSRGIGSINPDFQISCEGSYTSNNVVSWDPNDGVVADMHENGHVISEVVFNKDPNPYIKVNGGYLFDQNGNRIYNNVVEVRAEAINSVIYGKEYLNMIAETLNSNYMNINVDILKDYNENDLILHYFLAEKANAYATVETLQRYFGEDLNGLYVQNLLYGFESEWNM